MTSTGPVPAGGARRDRSRSHRVGPGLRRERVTVYVSAEERAALEARANGYGVSMSRVLVDGALHAGASELIDGATLNSYLAVLADVQRQIRGIAGNLNQLAHHANATQEFPADAAETARRAGEAIARLEDVLESVRR